MNTGDSETPPRPWRLAATAIGWSLVFGVIVLLVAGVVGVVAALAAAGSMDQAGEWLTMVGPGQIVVQGMAGLSGGLAASYLVGFRRFGMTTGDLRWSRVLSPLRGVALGLGFGVVPAALVLLLPVLLGTARWLAGEGGIATFFVGGGSLALVLSPAALAEEVLFRGVPLVLLAAAMGRGTGILVVAVVFGLAHLFNPHVTGLGVANVALAGILLGTVFYGPGGLWAAFGAHLGWNATLAALGASVSGLPMDMPALDYEPGGPQWLTGGPFGPEGGVLATVVLALAVVIAARSVRSSET